MSPDEERPTEPSADDIEDPTLRAEVSEAPAVTEAETGATADERPEPPPVPASEELKSAGTEEEKGRVADADRGAAGASPTGDAGAPPAAREPSDPSPPSPAATRPEPGTEPSTPEQPAAEQPALAEEASPPAAEVPTAEPEAPPEPSPGELDPLRQGLLDRLTAALGDAVVGHHLVPGVDLWVRVRREAWKQAGRACRDQLGMRLFTFLSAVDWMPSPFGKSEDAGGEAIREQPAGPITTGVAGGDTRFQLLARVYSPEQRVGIMLKADLPDEDLSVETWSDVYAGANWHERETWEMFGIGFAGHPNLVHIYLPSEFEGYPLRKDFPLLAREVKPWPGIVDVEPMPGEEEGESEGAEA